MYVASEKDAERFTEAFVDNDEARKKLKGNGADYAGEAVGENGVIQWDEVLKKIEVGIEKWSMALMMNMS